MYWRITYRHEDRSLDVDYGEQGFGLSVATLDAHDIVNRHLIDFLSLFLEKNRKYAGLQGNSLGSRGKFVDLYRKTMVLKARLWDGAEEVGEDNREVILDMIGHLFLMLCDLEREQNASRDT